MDVYPLKYKGEYPKITGTGTWFNQWFTLIWEASWGDPREYHKFRGMNKDEVIWNWNKFVHLYNVGIAYDED